MITMEMTMQLVPRRGLKELFNINAKCPGAGELRPLDAQRVFPARPAPIRPSPALSLGEAW